MNSIYVTETFFPYPLRWISLLLIAVFMG